MTTTANILSGLGTDRLVYKQIGDDVGIIVGPRTVPRIILPGFRGYTMDLYEREFANQQATVISGSTYYVRVVPLFDGLTDTAGDYLTGVPTTENASKGTEFNFIPISEEYPCTGYQVWAGTGSGELFLQGTLDGRYSTYFEIGTTWSYTSSGATLSAKTGGIPNFVSAVEQYQSEGAVSSRTFLGGGKQYDEGYAKVSQTDVAASLSGGTSAEDDYTQWTGITDGSFRIFLGWKDEHPANGATGDWVDRENDLKSWFDVTGLDFSGAANMAGVATVIQTGLRAGMCPALYCGTDVETTIATWQSITDGSFDIYLDGSQIAVTGLDFSGDASMADIAATIQAGIRTATGKTLETVTWDATAGRFVIQSNYLSIGSELISDTGFDAAGSWTTTGGVWTVAGSQATASAGVGEWGFVYEAYDANTGDLLLFSIDVDSVADGPLYPMVGDGVDLQFGTAINTGVSGTVNDAVLTDSDDNDGLGLYCATNSDGVFNSISVKQIWAELRTISYLFRESTGVGTDVSRMIDGREASPTAWVNRIRKESTTETVTWDTDHFVITSPDTGDQYRIGFLSTAAVGTDISGSAYMDCDSSGNGEITWGQTAYRTVLGNGTSWGDWAEGMNFRLKSEADEYLIGYRLEDSVLHLDSDYVGDGFNGWSAYILDPFDDQVYISDLSDPFTYQTANILPLPIADSDRVTAIKRVGLNVAIFMEHHIWLLNSTSISNPRMVSNQYGAPNDACIVNYEGTLMFWSGEDFMVLSGGRAKTLDTEARVRAIARRISQYTPEPHGVFYPDEGGDVIKWYFGIDGSRKYNVAICFDPKRGNWWIENPKDAQCSTVIRDADDEAHIITGSTYDDAHSIPAFTFLHGDDYKSDGASEVTGATRQGVIATAGVGAATEMAGYLTCGTAGALATFQAVTSGYFKVTIDNEELDVGPMDFSGDASMTEVASTIQTALRDASGGLETCVYSTDHFIITSGTTTNQSNVDYLRPYYPTVNDTDLSDETYMTGREGQSTKTEAVSQITLTLRNMDNSSDSSLLYSQNDGEKGIYLYVCDTNGTNGQLARVISNTANTITVTPNFGTAPEAGWFWYLGAIVPSWTKWVDFNSPQHKQKMHGIAVTVRPGQDTDGNYLFIHGMQDLNPTVRTTQVQAIGGTASTVNTRHLKDKEATQHGVRVFRPNSVHDLAIEDITFTHAPRV